MGESTTTTANGSLFLGWWKCTTVSGNQCTALNRLKTTELYTSER